MNIQTIQKIIGYYRQMKETGNFNSSDIIILAAIAGAAYYNVDLSPEEAKALMGAGIAIFQNPLSWATALAALKVARGIAKKNATTSPPAAKTDLPFTPSVSISGPASDTAVPPRQPEPLGQAPRPVAETAPNGQMKPPVQPGGTGT